MIRIRRKSPNLDFVTVEIPLGNGRTALIDEVDLPKVSQFTWYAVKYYRAWYARTTYMRRSCRHSKSMHRLIALTPADKVCHHRNRNTLDNRRANLLNLSRDEHKLLHRNNSLLIKFEDHPKF